jgi:hypothetical protein
MSQYIPIHLPLQSLQTPPPLPERPISVSTSSTVGSPCSPNPYSASFIPTAELPPSPPQSEDVKVPIFPEVLDPNLLLSARQIKSEFLRRDTIFARFIVAILAQRIELGILSPSNGIGFPFTNKDERKVRPSSDGVWLLWKSCRSSGWDLELGFNVHSYRERYPQVLALAHQDLEIRGFIVDKFDLEQDENGIYIKYSLSLPEY